MTGHFYCEKFRRTCKELTNESENDRSLFIVKIPSDLEEKPGTFIMVEKVPSDQKKYRRDSQRTYNESEKNRKGLRRPICKELKMTEHFYRSEKYRRTRKELIKSPRMTGHFVKSTVGLRRKTRNFYNGEKFRRTRKELTNESKNDRSLL